MQNRIQISLTIIIFLAIACHQRSLTLKPTFNKGGFTISTFQKESKTDGVVFGKVIDIQTKELISAATIEMGCLTFKSDDLGTYKFSRNSISKDLFLTCSYIGYRTIETERFEMKLGDSIKIDFFLIADDRPLINCEGIK